jgi:5-methylcytosine-specific restriction endonuclease McrA
VCRFPGCDHRRFLHAHHIVHWSDGGATQIDNLVLLCSAHHSQVHDEGWHIERRPDGDFVFHRPADRRTLEPVADLPLPTRDQLEAWLERI